MIRDILDSLRWNARLGAKFFWAVPGPTAIVVLGTLISQVSMLLAFFLPLKVIILLGSDGVPRYFPPSFERVDRDALIIWLTIATIAFYLFYLLAERVIAWGAERGAARLLARSRKMVLFEGQEQLATQSYKRYAAALAGGVFVLLALLLLLWLYPAVGWLMVIYASLAGGSLVALLLLSSAMREKVQASLASWTAVMAAVGFMLAFGYLVVDFLYRDPPGLIPAIIALLLSRQSFNRLGGLVPSLTELYQQRSKLDALFFHRTAYIPESVSAQEGLHELMLPEKRELWVPQVLGDLAAEPPSAPLQIHWKPTGIGGIHALQCQTATGHAYRIKLFAPNRSAQAVHEATLLASPPDGLPGPEWVGATYVRTYHCHVFRLGEDEGAEEVGGNRVVGSLRKALLQVEPSKALVTRYSRSRSFVWQRLAVSMLLDLRVAADAAEHDRVTCMVGRLDEWRSHLASLPLGFTLPKLRPLMVAESRQGDPLLLHWGRWVLEPVGAGWPVSRRSLRYLHHGVVDAAAGRPTLEGVSENILSLSALTAQFESAWQEQRFDTALRLLARIEHCLDLAGGKGESRGGIP